MTATPPTVPAEPQPLLAEFPTASGEQWKTLVEAELKGAPFDKRMLTATPEGITLRALYRGVDTPLPPHAASLPGFAPFVRGTRASGYLSHPWEVSQEIAVPGAAEFNDAARSGLDRGLTALNIVLDRATRQGADPDWAQPGEVGVGGLSLASLEDLARALEGIDLEKVPLFIRSGASGMPVGALLVALARERGCDPARLQGCIEIDPLGVLSHEGRLPQSLEAAFLEMASLTSWAARHAPRLQTICVHSRAWHEAGAHAAQELAFTLATALEYLRELHARGLAVEDAAPRIRFAYTVGTRFFMEIAKLRAARLLWARLVSALGASEASQRASLHVRTSLINKTRYDPYVNILRSAVEAFSGVLGGCDSMQVGPFDEVLRPPTEFSQRVARNQQLVLRDECHLTRVIDPAGGSWFVESLTNDLARQAWGVFQEIERQGGMTRCMRAGWPQRECAKTAEARLRSVAQRRESLIGTNVYANAAEKPLEVPPVDHATFHRRRSQQIASARTAADDARHRGVLDRLGSIVDRMEKDNNKDLFEACIAAAIAGATLGEITRAARIQDRPDAPITPVCLVRLAEGFERIRHAVDAYATRTGQRPIVFLANMGPVRQHKARADFARGFLEAAGLDVISPAGFATPDEAAAAAIEAKASIVCICSTDETYPALVGPLIHSLRAVRPGMIVVLAGHPPDQVEAHKAAGVDAFVHMRADAVEVLAQITRKLGGIIP